MKSTMKMAMLAAVLGIASPKVFASAGFCVETMTAAFDWSKSATGTWAGMHEGKMHWYKLDAKGGLWQSHDGKKWAADKAGTWMDKEGKWLKVHEGKLVWSTDGNTWSEVPEWKWEGADGKWYKFDTNWKLWVNG
ncbi:hypothetical protein [Chitinophaga caseinilytica]|uniref:hypothetical protein n=1 Tax=Chitinophaga caseinilytica TaxID=2267521 RepID=UPI003C2C9992